MLSKKLLVLTSNINDYNPKRLKEEAELQGIETDLVQYHDLVFKIDKSIEIWAKAKLVEEYDFLVLRGTGASGFNFFRQRDALVKAMMDKNIKVLNNNLFLKYAGQFDKLMQTVVLKKEGLPVVPSSSYGYFDELFENEVKLPFVMKKVIGSHGSSVKKINTKRGIKYFAAVIPPWESLCQPYLPTGEDIRVLVVGGKVIGAMKRIAQEGKFLTNVSAGGGFESMELTKQLIDLAERGAKAFEADYAGVDVMYDEHGEPYILEVNKAAEFKGFEACTKVNVAKEIIDFFVK